jgi:SAM-dependent methyltransferase
VRQFSVTNPAAKNWGSGINAERMAAVSQVIKPAMKVLDVGCGRGAYVNRLSQQGVAAFGLDIATYDDWVGRMQGTYFSGSADRMPFSDGAFDYALAFEVLEHCPDALATLREIHRCVRRGIILSVPDCDLNNKLRHYDLAFAHWTDRTHVNQFTRQSIQEALEEAGFHVVNVEGCYRIRPWKYFCDTCGLPFPLKQLLTGVVKYGRLGEEYWSSILVIAEKKRTHG